MPTLWLSGHMLSPCSKSQAAPPPGEATRVFLLEAALDMLLAVAGGRVGCHSKAEYTPRRCRSRRRCRQPPTLRSQTPVRWHGTSSETTGAPPYTWLPAPLQCCCTYVNMSTVNMSKEPTPRPLSCAFLPIYEAHKRPPCQTDHTHP
jgi:hypothetical protein